jgi:hypothetical protein
MKIKLIKEVTFGNEHLITGTKLISVEGLFGYFKFDDVNDNTIYQLHESDYEVEEYDELN